MSDNKNPIDGTTPLGLLRYSKQFLIAYECLKNNPELRSFSPVLYYLFCHGAELVLKSFLRHKKCSVEELKEIRHSIKKLLDMSENNGLIISPKTKQVLLALNPYYQNKEFEYIQTGPKVYPHDTDLYSALIEINRTIAELESMIASQM